MSESNSILKNSTCFCCKSALDNWQCVQDVLLKIMTWLFVIICWSFAFILSSASVEVAESEEGEAADSLLLVMFASYS